ncbi:2-C-methyl-D-erythritol 4-phosphate cytidylyltransferase [Fidelibacter multiformis]|jgi:2-C-methyl-D-erythritol 4-phosphate cytidylyltransferase|uniref:2-C-methyl-D-erythritol 4-phosphate cytidylyltransferase n=1 Tax=Fidelibacter multiformis TaxID=3377529 RepID=UPI0037DCECBC
MQTLAHESVSVIIPAAGQGKRMGASVPKPFLSIKDKPVLWYTLTRFLTNPLVSEIILVVSPAIREDAETLAASLKSTIPVKIREGGKERQDSVWQGIQAATPGNSVLAVHDAVRPFFAPSVLHDGMQLLKKFHGAAAGIPVVHTIKKTEGQEITGTVPRDSLVQIHTPQLFHASILKTVYEKAYSDHFYGTDECMLAERYGYKLAVIPDTPDNIKITTPFDLQMAEMLVKKYESSYWPGI